MQSRPRFIVQRLRRTAALTLTCLALGGGTAAHSVVADQVTVETGSGEVVARALPSKVVAKDPKDPKADWDIRKVAMYSENEDHELAALNFTFAEGPTTDDGFAVLWNLDKDSKPDMLMYTIGQSVVVEKVDGWNEAGKDITGKGCVGYYGADGGDPKKVTILFDPECLGDSARFQINAMTYHQVNGFDRVDYLPGDEKWTKAVDSVIPFPGN